MTKITPDHLVRSAYVYIRQSTLDQVHRNHESRRRQYGLAEPALEIIRAQQARSWLTVAAAELRPESCAVWIESRTTNWGRT